MDLATRSAQTETAAPRGGGSLPALTGLRAVAVILVLVVHASSLGYGDPHVAGQRILQATTGVWGFGGVGVDLFFVLSGFLLFTPYAESILRGTSWPSTRRFYSNRARRILPAYWTALVLLLIFGPSIGADPTGGNGSIFLHFVLLQNWTVSDSHAIDGVFWTMAIEVQFYLALPLVARGVAYVARRFDLVGVLLLAIFVVTPSAEAVRHYVITSAPRFDNHLSIIDLWEFGSAFIAGMTVASMRAQVLSGCSRWEPRFRSLATTGVVVVAGRFVISVAKVRLGGVGDVTFNTSMAVGFGAVLLGVLHLWPRLAHALSARWMVFVGAISYSVYIWHFPIYTSIVMPVVDRTGAGLPGILVLTAVIVIPICWVSYRLTERPFYRTRA